MKTTLILLAGGSGTRMQAPLPKQFLLLDGKPVAKHSFDLFLAIQEIAEIVVVCDPFYRHVFETPQALKPVHFALPGVRRQDSVYHGLQAASESSECICIHDSARPLIDKPLILRLLEAVKTHEAATVGVPIKFTVKEVDARNQVISTPERSRIWEIQTPQALKRAILLQGFRYALAHGITVTDDVSLAELIHQPVQIIEGSPHNLKITFPMDLAIAEHLLQSCER